MVSFTGSHRNMKEFFEKGAHVEIGSKPVYMCENRRGKTSGRKCGCAKNEVGTYEKQK